MFNKKLIIDSLKNLSKPSRMTNKNTFDLKESGSKREGFISAQEGVDTPIYKAVKTGASPIEGKGLFAEQSIRKGDVIGVSHIRKKFMKNGEEYKAPFPSTVLGYYNHSEEPNVYEVDKGDYILMVAGRDIQRGHEITSDYTKHNIGDLEVPDDFKKGGSIKRPSLPNRKSPRSYSRSFEATNKLFAKNPLFAKSKSRKNKIFDPRAQYFDNGGISKLEGDLISKVIMNRNRGVDFVDRAYALGDNPGTPMFNLPDDEQFGQNMSHKMAWGDDDNGQAWMYPTIMNPNNEAIPVPNQYADYISSEGYKNATGMNQYAEGGLHKFVGGGGNPTCPKDYKWNPETNRCEKKSGCPENFHFDLKSGRCISNYQKEGKATIKVRPKGTNTYVTATPDQLTAPYDNFWPEDLNLEEIANPVYFPKAQRFLNVTYPNQKNKYDDNLKDLATIRRYPDLNYKVVIDPSKPEGFNKNENIYYVKSENTHQARKYKEWEQLKTLEKQNIQKLTDAGFNVDVDDEEIDMLPNVNSDYYTYSEPFVDADGITHTGERVYKEGWDYQKLTDLERPPQEYYNDPEYLGHVPQNVSFEDFYKGRPGTSMEEYTSRCKDCSYVHGTNYKVDDDYLYKNINLSNVDLPNDDDDDWEIEKDLEYDYADPSIESMYPKLEFEEGVDRPDYYPSDYDMEIPTIGTGPGKRKSKKHTKRLFGKGQKYSWTSYSPTKKIEFGEKEVTRPIPRMVQKATGYDRKFMEGYEDEEGNYIPGEIEKAEQEGRQINFKGASSLRDRKQQKIYNEKWKNSEEENKLIRQQNEDLLKEYGLNREEYVKLYGEFKNGGLIKAADGYTTGVGDEPSITATPFDFRSSYGQIGNYHKNPNYSLTYTNPKLFKKMDMSSNALSFTLGRPYNTDDASLTNPTLDFSDNTEWDYNYNGWQDNPAYQNFWQNATGGGNNQSTFDSYQATQNLASLKPKYKKGLPLVADIGYDLVGNAFGSSSSGPFTGAAGWHVGYAPESGLYGNMDASIMGVFGRRKNKAKIKPNRYYSEGLTRQGDYAFIPKLNILNFQVKQRPDYNKVQEDELVRLMKEDAINGTRTARPYAYKIDSQDPFDMSFLSPELTFQAKPFKNIPGILSATAGARLNFEGGKQREGVPITPNLYGNVRYTIPLGEAKRKISARMPDRRNYQNDEEREETETETETENETNGKSTFDEDIQLNFDGQGVGKANCRDGYERPCEKCKCQKIKLPTPYTDKRGKKIFGNEPITFKQGGISLQLTKDEIQKYVDGGYVVEDLPKARFGKISKTLEKIARSNYNPLSIPIKKIGYNIATQHAHFDRTKQEIVDALKGKSKSAYFGNTKFFDLQNYGPGKRDLVANYFRENETGFKPIDYDIKSDSGLFAAIEEYGPLKVFAMNSEIPHGEPISPFLLHTADVLRDKGINSGTGTYEPLLNFKFPKIAGYGPEVTPQYYLPDGRINPDFLLHEYLRNADTAKIIESVNHPELQTHVGYLKDFTRARFNTLFDESGTDVIPFEVGASSKARPNFLLETNPVKPLDNVAGHMAFLKRLPNKEFELTSRDLWGFTPSYDSKWSMNTAFQKAQRKAMHMFGKPFVLTQTNPIKFKQGGESNYELGDTVDKATMERLKELGYTFETI